MSDDAYSVAKIHNLATSMDPPKIKQNCIKLHKDKNMILYYEFSPWRVIKCLLKLLSRDEAYSHIDSQDHKSERTSVSVLLHF